MGNLRCTALPKLAQCPSWEGKRGEMSAPALRGIAMDIKWRANLAWKEDDDLSEEDLEMMDSADLTKDDCDAVKWAADRTRIIAGDAAIATWGDEMRIRCPWIPAMGEMDGVIWDKNTLVDLKSGQIRNYREQMAAYALGCMKNTFSQSWTAHLIFCDHREVRTHTFTYTEAEKIVTDIVAAYHDEEKIPTPCDYCGWCAKARTCDARMVLSQDALTFATQKNGIDGILKNPEKLSRFIKGAKIVLDYLPEAKEEAKFMLECEVDVPGFKRVPFNGREYVDRSRLMDFISCEKGSAITPYDLLQICAAPTPKKLRELIDTMLPDAAPEEVEAEWNLILRKEDTSQLREKSGE